MRNWIYFALKDIIKNDLDTCYTTPIDYDYVSVYPNPTSDKIQIQLTEKLKISTIKVFNIDGKMVKMQKNNSNTAEVNIANLTNGIYLLLIEAGNNKIVMKIIKKDS